jgi:hypothetical protein
MSMPGYYQMDQYGELCPMQTIVPGIFLCVDSLLQDGGFHD